MTSAKNILVLDLGSTHLKASVVSPHLQILFEQHQKNERITCDKYTALDVASIGKFIENALEKTVDEYGLGDIIVSTHGSAIALLNDENFSPFKDNLTLPVMFYGQEIPDDIRQQYKQQAPDFCETFADVNPLALTGAQQLFWQASAWPFAFKKTTKIMMWASYWAFRLSGVACNDYSSLGAQNQIWNPSQNDFSSVIKQNQWHKLFAAPRASMEKIGVLHDDICRKYHFKNRPNILCGVHDSNANYWRFVKMGFDKAAVISTGTWIINFNPNLAAQKLQGKPDCCANTSVLGNIISCSRYQGGLELSLILKSMGDIAIDTVADSTDLKNLLQSNSMIRPSFASSGGPVPSSGSQGEIMGRLPADNRQKYSLALLYIALMTQLSLSYIEANDSPMLIIDGPFTQNPLFLQLMAVLNPHSRIYISHEANGTLLGAALLADSAQSPSADSLSPVHLSADYAALQHELKNYQQQWLSMILSCKSVN